MNKYTYQEKQQAALEASYKETKVIHDPYARELLTEAEAKAKQEAIMQRYFDYIKGKPVSIGVTGQGFAVHSSSTR